MDTSPTRRLFLFLATVCGCGLIAPGIVLLAARVMGRDDFAFSSGMIHGAMIWYIISFFFLLPMLTVWKLVMVFGAGRRLADSAPHSKKVNWSTATLLLLFALLFASWPVTSGFVGEFLAG